MMTHEEIEAAIERLSTLDDDNHPYSMRDVAHAFIGEDAVPIRLSHTLAYLLQQADPDTHISLPLDADGIPLHVGDEVYVRCKNATYGYNYYYNGRVRSLEFYDERTYAYVRADDDGDGDQFVTSELHHGSHTKNASQIIDDLLYDAFDLGVRSHCDIYDESVLYEKKEMIKRYTDEFAHLLPDEAETGFESECAAKLREAMADE